MLTFLGARPVESSFKSRASHIGFQQTNHTNGIAFNEEECVAVGAAFIPGQAGHGTLAQALDSSHVGLLGELAGLDITNCVEMSLANNTRGIHTIRKDCN